MDKLVRLIKYIIFITLFIVYLLTFKNFIYDMSLENFITCVVTGLVMLYSTR